MTEKFHNFFQRFLHHPLPVLFGVFYMYLTWDVYQWVKTLDNPKDAEFIMNGFVLGALGYFKFYTDLVMNTGKE